MTISAKDRDLVTNRPTGGKIPNVQIKTPIVVKRTEPGKAPTLLELPSGSKQQVGLISPT